MSNLNTGTYDLTASLSGYQSQTKTGIAVTGGQTTSGINFFLTANPSQQYGSLTGVISKTDLSIVAGATVKATLSGTTYTTTTNSSGVYTFTNLPVGTYTLKATYKGGLSGTGTAVVTSGQITTVNITIKKRK